MLAEIPTEQFASAVEASARETLAEANISAPPVDMLLLAERLDLLVARGSGMQNRARFVRLGKSNGAGQGAIFLADEPRPERRHWAIAHEVGESIAHQVFAMLGVSLVDIPVSAREEVANHLASSLLLPHDWFSTDGSVLNWDLFDLKHLYSTASHELIARRQLEMRPSVIITLFDQGKPIWRQSNLPGRPPHLTEHELQTWHAAHDTGNTAKYDGDLPEGIKNIRCWPIHEPNWQREIIRIEIEQW